jgi:hypothetical protein
MVCTRIGMAPGTVTAVPVRSAVTVAGRPVCGPRLASCLPILSISAASRPTDRWLSIDLACSFVRIPRGVSRAPDRPRPWVDRPTGRSPRCGPVCGTVNSSRGRFPCGTGLWPRGRLVSRTDLGFRGALHGWSRPRLPLGQYRSPGRTGCTQVLTMNTGARVVSAPQQGAAAVDRRAGRPLPSDRPRARRSLLITSVMRKGPLLFTTWPRQLNPGPPADATGIALAFHSTSPQ